MTAPYGQPAPFDPAALPPTMNRRPKRKRPYLPVIGAVVLAAVAFAGGFAVANAVAPKQTTTGNGFAFNGQQFGPNASGRPRFGNGGGGFGGGAAGTIGSISADQMTVTTANGGQRIVLLTPSTTVTKVSSTTQSVTDLTTGETVTVQGTSNPDGSVTATNVVIGNIGIFGRGGTDGAAGQSAAP
jgi:hypothetical protein